MKRFRASKRVGAVELVAGTAGNSSGVALELDQVSVAFGGVQAVAKVSLSLTAQIVGVVGPNGAGKSTLLDCVSGLAEMNGGRVSGSIRYQGREIRGLVPEARAALGIGRSFQHPLLVPMLTVEEHLRLAVGTAGVRAPADELAETLGLTGWMHREIGELPYGMRKLLDIGRALAAGPHLLLCDEPLSGLDEAAREAMIETLAAVAAGGTAIMVVEHDFPRLVRLAADVVVMDFGQSIAQGSPQAIASDEEVRGVFLGKAAPAGR